MRRYSASPVLNETYHVRFINDGVHLLQYHDAYYAKYWVQGRHALAFEP